MFTQQAVLFLQAVSPVHAGGGTATGLIDNPIQRECHTQHPCIAGSGIKGAIRHSFQAIGGDENLIDQYFGPDASNSNLHAGAVSFGDANLVALPIRSLKNGYIMATCPQALARTQRLLRLLDMPCDWQIPQVDEGQCHIINEKLLSGDKVDRLHLEAFEYQAQLSQALHAIAEQLTTLALPSDTEAYFKDKLQKDMVLLSDTDFAYFCEHATLVEPHVRIDPATGTSKEGGLFYTENLPPESLMITPLLCSNTRGESATQQKATDVSANLQMLLDGRILQIGGHATT